MTDKSLTESDLGQFIGTTQWYRHPMFRGFTYTYTDGVQYMAEKGGAYWLLEAVFSHQLDKKAKVQPFQVWTLTRTPRGGASLVMTDGNTKREIIRQDIEYTDFPLQKISLYFCDNVLMLTSEY